MTEQSGHVQGVAITAGSARRGGTRWGVGLLFIAVTVGALGAIGTLVSTPTPPEAIGFVPAGSALVMELRADLPGNQRQALGTLLAGLPGFTDLNSVNDRVGAALDAVVAKASDGTHSYTGDLRPYAAGAAILAVPAALVGASGAATTPHGLAILTTEGSPGCAPLEAGRAVTVEEYRSTDVRSTQVAATGPSGSQAMVTAACAAVGRFVVIGDPDAVRLALDAHAQGRNVMGDAAYTAAFRAMTGDHAAWVYLNTRAMAGVASAAPMPSGTTRPAMPADGPEWLAMQMRLTERGPVFETAMPDPRSTILAGFSASPGHAPAANAVSAIAPVLPASTLALVEAHQAGALLSALQSRQAAVATSGGPAASAQAALGPSLALLGGLDAILGEVDQAAVALVPNGSSVTAGLVLQVANADAAAQRIDQLRGIAALAGLLGGAQITDQDFHGTRITTVPVGPLLAASSARGAGGGGGPGMFPGMGGIPGGAPSPRPSASAGPGASSRPSIGLPALPADARLSVAIRGSFVVVALDDAFVKAVLDTPAGGGLAGQPGYRAAVDAAGSPNLAGVYANLAALGGLAPLDLPAAEAGRMASARPYLEAFGALAGSLTSGDGLLRGRLVITLP